LSTELDGTNTYSGITTVNGALAVGNSAGLGAGSGTAVDGTIVNAGGTLSTTSGVTLGNELITLNGGTLNLSTNGPVQVNLASTISGTFNGNISGAGQISFGASTTLAGANSYTCSLSIGSSQVVTVASATGLSSQSPATTVKTGGTLNLNAATAAPITFGGGTVTLNVDAPQEQFNLVAGTLNLNVATAAPITFAGGTVNLNADIPERQFSVGAGTLNVNVASSASATVTPGGTVSINSTAFGPVLVNGGTLALGNPAGPVTSNVTLQSGNLSGVGTFQSAINVAGQGSITGSTSRLTLNGGVTGGGSLTFGAVTDTSNQQTTVQGPFSIGGNLSLQSGTVTLNGTVQVAGATTVTGGTTTANFNGSSEFVGPFSAPFGNLTFGSATFDAAVSLQGHNFTFTNASTFHGPVLINQSLFLSPGQYSTVFKASNTFDQAPLLQGGSVNFTASNTLPGLTLNGNQVALTTSNGATLTSTTPFDFRSGDVYSASLVGPGINKSGFGVVYLDDLGTTTNAPIALNQGTLVATPQLLGASNVNPLGGPGNSMTVAPRDAVLSLDNNLVVSTPINFNNSTGAYFSGAIMLYSNQGVSTLSGTVNVGSDHSILGNAWISGQIVGSGGLTAAGLLLKNASETYSGPTVVTSNAISSGLFLQGTARLSGTSEIDVEANATLGLDYAQLPIDHVPDTTPLFFDGGSVLASGLGSNPFDTGETLGTVSLRRGSSAIGIAMGQGFGMVRLTELDRSTGATVTFNNAVSSHLNVYITTPPPLTNGIIGGWALTAPDGVTPYFATYGSSGVTFASTVPSLAGAGPSSNVDIAYTGASTAIAPLTADQTINSFRNQFAPSLDLGGHTLNVNSGAVMFVYGGEPSPTSFQISNGNLTAGDHRPGSELFLYTYVHNTAISANVVDNPGGSVALVKGGDATITLTGTNTYSGGTYVDRGQLIFASPASVPSNSPLDVNGGTATFQFSSGPITVPLANVEIRGGGALQTNGAASVLTPTSILIEAGTINAALSGSVAITKTTEGFANLAVLSSWLYSGTIDIQNGTLEGTAGTDVLGSGTIHVHQGANFINGCPVVSNPIQLEGDLSATTGGSLATFSGKINVDGPAATLTVFDPLKNVMTVQLALTQVSPSPTFLFTGNVSIAPGAALSQLGTAQAITFQSGISNNGALLLGPGSVSANGITGAGTAAVAANGILTSTVVQQQSLSVAAGGRISLSASQSASRLSTLTLSGTTGAWTSTIDVGGDTLVIDTTASAKPALIAQLEDQVNSGRNGGNWQGLGITSPAAAADPRRAIAVIDNAQLGLSQIGGQNIDGNSVLVLAALLGDTNADGVVNVADLANLAGNFGVTGGATWISGDFDYNGNVNIADLADLAGNFGKDLISSGLAICDARSVSASTVPEPVALAFLVVGAGRWVTRRRHRRQS
jgi:autotransporter-associated beta strand protein